MRFFTKILVLVVAINGLTGCTFVMLSRVNPGDKLDNSKAYVYGEFQNQSDVADSALIFKCADDSMFSIPLTKKGLSLMPLRPAVCSLQEIKHSARYGYLQGTVLQPLTLLYPSLQKLNFEAGKAYYIGAFDAISRIETRGSSFYLNSGLQKGYSTFEKNTNQLKQQFPWFDKLNIQDVSNLKVFKSAVTPEKLAELFPIDQESKLIKNVRLMRGYLQKEFIVNINSMGFEKTLDKSASDWFTRTSKIRLYLEHLAQRTLQDSKTTAHEKISQAVYLGAIADTYEYFGVSGGSEVQIASYYGKSSDVFREVLGKDHELTFDAVSRWAIFLNSINQYQKASKIFGELLVQQQAKYGDSHIMTATTKFNLASALAKDQKNAEALVLYEAFLKFIADNPVAPDAKDKTWQRHELKIADFYEKTGKSERAAEIRSKHKQ